MSQSTLRNIGTVVTSALLGLGAAGMLVYTFDRDTTVLPVTPTPTVTVTQPLPDLPESCDVTMEGDEAHVYPCSDSAIDSVTDASGIVHEWCRVVLISMEDSVVVCTDGWSASS